MTNYCLHSGAAKDDFWVYNATAQEQYDFVIEKTKNLPAKYLTAIKKSDPQSCLPILRLVSKTFTFNSSLTYIELPVNSQSAPVYSNPGLNANRTCHALGRRRPCNDPL